LAFHAILVSLRNLGLAERSSQSQASECPLLAFYAKMDVASGRTVRADWLANFGLRELANNLH
jgi:hypothetical protein